MKKLAFVISIFFVLVFENCQPKEIGCTDTNALNFNASASISDSRCTYEADKFIGDYKTEDVIEYDYSSSGGVRISQFGYNRYSFTIIRETNQSIRIKNFGNCNTDIIARKGTVYNRFFDNKIELEGMGACKVNYIKFELNNDTLSYSYTKVTDLILAATGKTIIGTATGKAVRK
jgi:hypothetical protein